MKNKSIPYLLLLLLFMSCEEDTGNTEEIVEAIYNVSIDAAASKGEVSPLLMGFGTIYSFDKDELWLNGEGQIPTLLKKFNTSILRYPGGAVTNRYHWNNLNGQGWKDNWDPDYDTANDLPAEGYMDVDEYMANIEAIGAEAMLGINMGSGLKYDRVQDGIDEAVALLQYCKDKGYDVKYWYYDNESYHKGANYKMTALLYAEQINLYAPALRAIDPNIQFIANWTSNITSNTSTLENLIREAGDNIDIMEIHWYWEFGLSTFEKWLNSFPMNTTNQWYNGLDYVSEMEAFKTLVNSLQHSHIKLASNEWNIGPSPTDEETPSKFESALMISEQFTQFIDGGMFMACFWGMHWPQDAPIPAVNRYLLDPTDNFSLNPLASVFEMFSDAMGGNQVECISQIDGVYDIAVINEAGDEMYIYLLNKKQENVTLSTGVEIKNFSFSEATATTFFKNPADADKGILTNTNVKINKNNQLELSLFRNSLTKVVLTK